ncbi:MAG: hypothetical protein J2P19_18320 [Pseudonocardia sp.]|nr:hypothetical protein [Pseudonocardia sp.]
MDDDSSEAERASCPRVGEVVDLFATVGLADATHAPQIPVLAIERVQGLDDIDDVEKWEEVRLIAPDLEDTTRYLLVLQCADER